jgi:hypothetical protein
MTEANKIEFPNVELLKILLKEKNIKEGNWVLSAAFNFAAINIGQSPDGSDALPAGMVALAAVVIERVPEPLSFSIDASEI